LDRDGFHDVALDLGDGVQPLKSKENVRATPRSHRSPHMVVYG
jgi:hypothetical protein